MSADVHISGVNVDDLEQRNSEKDKLTASGRSLGSISAPSLITESIRRQPFLIGKNLYIDSS